MPNNKASKILVISCGPGYFVNTLNRHGYQNVLGIDSIEEKVTYAKEKGLSCEVAEAFPFLEAGDGGYDVIFCEQELNHLTKDEIIDFLGLCYKNLVAGGMLITHVLNGANPITGAEALAQNFDHYNTFTEYSARQVHQYTHFKDITVFPLNLYVFWTNPLNYVLLALDRLYGLFFRFSFMLYGKKNKIWTKKISVISKK